MRKINILILLSALVGINHISMAYAHGFAEDRLHYLSHAITESPNDSELYIKRGRIYLDSERWNEALANFDKAIEIGPNYYQALFWQADALIGKQDYETAKTKLLAYLAYVPQSPAGHRALAKVYIQSGDLLQAAKQFDQAISVDANPLPQMYLERAHNLMKTQPFPAKRIRAGLFEGLTRYPANVVLIKQLIESELAVKNYTAALAAIDRLPQILQLTPQWLNQKAEIELLRGQPTEAIKYYHASLAHIAALPKSKQALPAFVKAKHLAEMRLADIIALLTMSNHSKLNDRRK